jgi:GAF domain-containing protein
MAVRPSLAERMMAAARELQEESDPQATLQAAARLASDDINGCDSAAISLLRRNRTIVTPAATSEVALAGDTLQYALNEGPCLDAVWEERVVHSADLETETRWPAWSRRMVRDHGVRGVLCFQLFTYADTVGALNLYSRTAHSFDAQARDEGLALAAHIAIAVAAAQRIEQLDQALLSRTVIGQACGILMERYAIDADRAFALLARVSSQSNVKIRELASELVETRGMIGLEAEN